MRRGSEGKYRREKTATTHDKEGIVGWPQNLGRRGQRAGETPFPTKDHSNVLTKARVDKDTGRSSSRKGKDNLAVEV